MDELSQFFKKVGVIGKDPQNGQLKIKIYTDSHGKPKGDCRVGYENFESTDLALEILNG